MKRVEGKFSCLVYRAVILYLRKISNQMYVVLKPPLIVQNSSDEDLPREVVNKIKLDILSNQYNAEFNQEMQRWREKLFPDKPQTVFEYPPNNGSTFRFRVRKSPIFAAIGKQGQGKAAQIRPSVQPLVKQKGIQVEEPPPIFVSKRDSRFVNDIHPVRGLTNNRPYDFALTQQGLAQNIKLRVICPQREGALLETYLNQTHSRHQVPTTMQDHLLDYPGFAQAYGIPVEIPSPESPGWVTCAEPSQNLDAERGSLELARLITQSISKLESVCQPHVTLVFIPDRWNNWRGYESDSENFDLHDFVKAYCVQKGITSQFLEQSTMTDPYQCRVWWWLSLALYTKSMRTPWILDSLDPNTAFVGLGFSIKPKAKKGEHIVLGCSHLYNSRGEGLQFRW
jgi:hypothetical protein